MINEQVESSDVKCRRCLSPLSGRIRAAEMVQPVSEPGLPEVMGARACVPTRVLSDGQMGRVYLANDEISGRQVAIKKVREFSG